MAGVELYWWLLICTNTVLGLGPTALSILRKRNDIFECRHIMMLYIWLQFSLWPAWVMLGGYTTFYTIRIRFLRDYAESTTPALLLVTLAILCFHLGYFLTSRQCAYNVAKTFNFAPRSMPEKCMQVVYLSFGITGVAAGLLFVSASGGLQLILHIDDFRSKSLAGAGPYFTGLNLLSFAFLLAMLRDCLRRTVSMSTIGLFGLAVLLSLLCGFRHMFVASIVFFAISYHYAYKRITLNARFFVVAFAFIAANFLYVSFRSTGNIWELFTQPDTFASVLWNGFFCRFHGLESVVRVIHATNDNDYLGVWPAWQNFLNSFVPRKLFPEKPLSLGIVGNLKFFGDAFTESDTGACVPTLLGDLYWIGGIGAVAVGTFVLGSIAQIARFLSSISVSGVMGVVLYAQLFIFFFFVNEDLFLHGEQLIHRCILIFIPLMPLKWFLVRASVSYEQGNSVAR